MWYFEYLVFVNVSKRSIQIRVRLLIHVPNLTCMCKGFLLKRFHAKVKIFIQNFQQVAYPHKICVPHDDYLELVVSLSNSVLYIRVPHQFLLKQWYFITTFLWVVSFQLKTSRYVKKEHSCKENVFGGTLLKWWTSIVALIIRSFLRGKQSDITTLALGSRLRQGLARL
jgi:hypothetical protein